MQQATYAVAVVRPYRPQPFRPQRMPFRPHTNAISATPKRHIGHVPYRPQSYRPQEQLNARRAYRLLFASGTAVLTHVIRLLYCFVVLHCTSLQLLL